MFDLYVPSERYEQELSKLKQQQAQLDDNKDMVCPALFWVHFTCLVIFYYFKFPMGLVTYMKQNTSKMLLCYKNNREFNLEGNGKVAKQKVLWAEQ